MKITSRLTCMAVIVVLAASPMALAQRAGFQIGISQPAVALPPVQAPAIATRGTFIGNSLPIEAGPIVIIQNQLIAPIPVFIPNQVLVPTPFFAPAPFLTPTPFSRPFRVLRQILRFCPIRCSLPLRVLYRVRLFFRARSRLSTRCHLKLRFRSTSSFLVRPSSPAQPPAQSYNRKCSPLLDLL